MTRAVGILGLGHYVPEKIITNTDMEKIVETSDEWICLLYTSPSPRDTR